MEQWKDIQGYEGCYQISDIGNVKSLSRERFGNGRQTGITKERILKFNKDTSGYNVVKLYKNGSKKCPKAHRLVAKAFIPNPNNKGEINHINGVKTDNRLTNLEWCTHTENIRHADATGLRDVCGE